MIGPAERMKSHDEVVEEVQGRVKDVGLLPKGRVRVPHRGNPGSIPCEGVIISWQVQQLVRQSSRSLSRAEELVKQDVEEMKSNKEEMMTQVSEVLVRKIQNRSDTVHQALHIPKMCLVVVGHVDSGKSTLMGHLLVELVSIYTVAGDRTRDLPLSG